MHPKDEKKKQKMFREKLNKHPHKRRASGLSLTLRKAHSVRVNKSAGSIKELIAVPNLDFVRSTSLGTASRKSRNSTLPRIHERDGRKHYTFRGLNPILTLPELEHYKLKYFDSDSVYQRLLPHCKCELCVKEHKNTPTLKKTKTAYKLNGSLQHKALSFKQQSLSIYSSNHDLGLSNSNSSDSKQLSLFLGGFCQKEETLPLIEVMGIGIKNNKHNFMHILNDINTKMIWNNRHTPWILYNQKSAPTPLNAISDEAETIARSYTEQIRNKQESVSSCSNDSSYCSEVISPNEDTNICDEVPILKVRKLRKVRSLHPAIRSYHNRLAKPLDFKPKYCIIDNVQQIVDIVRVMTHIVLMFSLGHSMPFQIDLVIIPKRTQTKGNNDNDNDDDDDDDEDDDGFKTDDDDEDEDVISNDIGDMLKKGLNKKHYDRFHSECIPLIRSDKEIHEFKCLIKKIGLFHTKNPMQNGRYVIIVDRDGNHSKSFIHSQQKDKMDYMYFFQPPAPYGEIIDHTTMIEILHINTLDCLIPKINNEKKEEFKEEFIGAKHLCKGQMICVSFHVLSNNEIRCYLYIDQKYMRIDDWTILDLILNDYVNNSYTHSNHNYEENRHRYKEFAFQTKDTIFDDYFNWANKHIKIQHKIASKKLSN